MSARYWACGSRARSTSTCWGLRRWEPPEQEGRSSNDDAAEGTGRQVPRRGGRLTVVATFFAVSFPGLAVLVIAFVGLETLFRRFTAFSFVPERLRRRREARSLSNVAFDVFTTSVNGNKEYELDERAAATMLRDEESDGAPPRSAIDLSAGKAVIVLPRHRDGKP
ncbi:DUF6191 domain-containing protein [Kitasatospora sp. NPDC050463]|uniref:DUF6191 domain-containing protein n=1 Tax=Kitasatospora sp. NPDC050463 TaxID=3155786 RepID=UPI00340D4C19